MRRAQVLAELRPRIKVILDCNSTADTLARPHTPKLLECCSSVDGGLVSACSLQDIVGTAISGDGTLLRSSRRGVVGAIRFDNVVFDKWVARPAVQGDVRVDGRGIPGT